MIKKHRTKLHLFIFAMLIFSASLTHASNVKRELIKDSNIKKSNDYAFQHCRSLQSKPFSNKRNKKKAIIIGDSQGCDLLNGIIENGYLKNYDISFRFIPYPCQATPGENPNRYVSPQNRRLCDHNTARTDNLELAKQQVKEADLVIFSHLWKPEVTRNFQKVVRYLNIKSHQKLIVVGNKFFGKMNIRKYLHMHPRQLKQLRNEVGTTSQKINRTLKQQVKHKGVFVDPHKILCGNDTSCPVFTNNLKLISYDGRHLTKAGAKYMAKTLFQKTSLKNLR